MFKILRPYFALYRHYFFSIILGLLLIILALCASLFLLSLSGWFLAMSAFVGAAGIYTFNYMLPATGVRFAAILRTVARYFERVVNHDITFKILAFLRLKAFKKLLPLTPAQLSHYEKADLLNRFIADIDHLDHLYLRLFAPVLSAIIVTFLLYIGLSFISPSLALIFTGILLIAILVFPFIFYFAGKQIGKSLILEQKNYRIALMNYLSGQAELILFNAETPARAQLNAIEQRWIAHQKKQSDLMAISATLVILISALLILCAFVFLAPTLSGDQKPLLALFVFIGLASAELLTPLSSAFLFLGKVLESAKRMNQLYQMQPDIQFPEKSPQTPIDLTKAATLNFENVTFSYQSDPKTLIFDRFNLSIKAGQKIAIMGASGAGKSTLFKLILREIAPQSGSIFVNQIAIDQFDEGTFCDLICVVPQTIELLSDTLRENLLIASPNASDEELILALKKVHLEKLIRAPEGLNLLIGEQGRALSGGEKRRIGIARGLLKKAPMILLDEPTEHLDQKNEREVMQLLHELYRDKTVIMITHKSTFLSQFDHILTLKPHAIAAI